jgi:hypothetical protein
MTTDHPGFVADPRLLLGLATVGGRNWFDPSVRAFATLQAAAAFWTASTVV